MVNYLSYFLFYDNYQRFISESISEIYFIFIVIFQICLSQRLQYFLNFKDWLMNKKVMAVFVDEIKANMAIAIAQNGQITGQVGGVARF